MKNKQSQRCPKHPKYTAKRKPTVDCSRCRLIWRGECRSNKQPFYHQLTVLFTATDDISTLVWPRFEKDIEKLFQKHFPKLIIEGTTTIGSFDAEPGDPADLM